MKFETTVGNSPEMDRKDRLTYNIHMPDDSRTNLVGLVGHRKATSSSPVLIGCLEVWGGSCRATASFRFEKGELFS